MTMTSAATLSTSTANIAAPESAGKSFHFAPGGGGVDKPQPIGVYGYPDTIRLHTSRPLTKIERDRLVELAGARDRVKTGVSEADYPGAWRYFTEITRPPRRALLYLREIAPQHYINRLDLALDWTFDTDCEKRDATAFFRMYHWQPRQRAASGLRFKSDPDSGATTRYTGMRWDDRHVVASYDYKPCRITGEVHCLHIEWRTYRRGGVLSLGVGTIDDLLDFDHRAFWQERLRLSRFDVAKVGRVHNNWVQNNSTRRRPWIERHGRLSYDRDRTVGGILARRELMKTLCAPHWPDRVRAKLKSCLVHFDVEDLLPPSRSALD